MKLSSSGTLFVIIVIVLLIPLLTMTILHKNHPRRCDRCKRLFTEKALQKHFQDDDCILTINGQQLAEHRIKKHTVERNYKPVLYYGAMPLPERSRSKAKQPPLRFEEEALYRHHGYSTDLRQCVEEAFRKRDAELETRRKRDAELETRRERRQKIQEDVAPRTGQSAGLVQERSVGKGDRAEESLEGLGNSIVSVDVLNEQLRGIPSFDDDGGTARPKNEERDMASSVDEDQED